MKLCSVRLFAGTFFAHASYVGRNLSTLFLRPRSARQDANAVGRDGDVLIFADQVRELLKVLSWSRFMLTAAWIAARCKSGFASESNGFTRS